MSSRSIGFLGTLQRQGVYYLPSSSPSRRDGQQEEILFRFGGIRKRPQIPPNWSDQIVWRQGYSISDLSSSGLLSHLVSAGVWIVVPIPVRPSSSCTIRRVFLFLTVGALVIYELFIIIVNKGLGSEMMILGQFHRPGDIYNNLVTCVSKAIGLDRRCSKADFYEFLSLRS